MHYQLIISQLHDSLCEVTAMKLAGDEADDNVWLLLKMDRLFKAGLLKKNDSSAPVCG